MKIPQCLRRTLFPNLQYRDEWVINMAQTVPPGARVLDIGAGSAPYRQYFKHCDYYTQDAAQLDPEKLRDRSFSALDFVCDASNIPISSGTIDVIVCTEVLEHVPEPFAVIGEISRLLAKGGVCFLTAPLGSGLHQEPYHFYGGYTPHFYRLAGVRFGLTVETIIPNGDSVMHFKQWLVWIGAETVKSIKRRPIRGFFTSLLVVPPIAISFLVVPLVRLAWDDERFTVGYHLVMRKN
jgi:SAM-dependent methyltransferase